MPTGRRILLAVVAALAATSGCNGATAGAPERAADASMAGMDSASGDGSGDTNESSDTGGGGSTDAAGADGPNGGDGSGFDGGAGEAGSCSNPTAPVPSSRIPTYVALSPEQGACTPAEISNVVAACASTGTTRASCNAYLPSVSASCAACLALSDAGMLGGAGGALWFDYEGQYIGLNEPACLGVEGNMACASAYSNIIQCPHSAGCQTCATQADFDACFSQVAGPGGVCASYETTYLQACGGDSALSAGGACSTSADVLSVLCGNGSGDGG
jgi:hypothetical protein